MMSPIPLVASLLIASWSLPAQTVWNMGSPWLDLDQVLALAAPGDIVRLNGLQFPPFTVTKGLTMIGPGTILPFLFSSMNQVTTFTIPTGEQAHIVDLDFTPHPIFGMVTNRVEASGRVTFEGCNFGAGAPANLIVSGTILLHHCSVAGNGVNGTADIVGGMRVQGGICCITNSTLRGANTVFSSGYQLYTVPSTPALTVNAATVLVSASNVIGGAGLAHPIFGPHRSGSPAIVTTGATLISDCSLAGGSSPSTLPGPAALVGNGSTFHGRTTMVGGGGSTTGPPTSGFVHHLPQIVGMRISPHFRLGAATTLTATSGSSQPLGMVASFDPTPTNHPAVQGPILGSLAQLVPIFLTAPSPGLQVSHTITVPNQPQLFGVGIHAQAYQLDGNVVRVSAGVGGVVH